MDCDIFTFLWSLYIEISGSSHSKVFLKSKKKIQKNDCEKVHFHVYFTKILRKLKVISLFFWIKIRRFRRKLNVSDQIKPRFSFWLKINLRKMACNKHVDLRRIESLVRSKGKTANFQKTCKNFKIVDKILIYIEKRWVIFDNDRKILNHNTTLFYR